MYNELCWWYVMKLIRPKKKLLWFTIPDKRKIEYHISNEFTMRMTAYFSRLKLAEDYINEQVDYHTKKIYQISLLNFIHKILLCLNIYLR